MKYKIIGVAVTNFLEIWLTTGGSRVEFLDFFFEIQIFFFGTQEIILHLDNSFVNCAIDLRGLDD
jgi:hypothetical protein